MNEALLVDEVHAVGNHFQNVRSLLLAEGALALYVVV